MHVGDITYLDMQVTLVVRYECPNLQIPSDMLFHVPKDQDPLANQTQVLR